MDPIFQEEDRACQNTWLILESSLPYIYKDILWSSISDAIQS